MKASRDEGEDQMEENSQSQKRMRVEINSDDGHIYAPSELEESDSNTEMICNFRNEPRVGHMIAD